MVLFQAMNGWTHFSTPSPEVAYFSIYAQVFKNSISLIYFSKSTASKAEIFLFLDPSFKNYQFAHFFPHGGGEGVVFTLVL